MARLVSNVDIITDSFEIWLLQTNELLNSLSTEIITANSTYANTGNSTFARTSQLFGTFGANNMMVNDWLRGGNVNAGFANLMISTNTVLSNTAAANLQLAVSNSTSNSYLNPIGVYLGLGTANAFVNTTAMVVESNSISNTLITARSIILQSNSTVNSNYSDTLIQVANSTSTANMNAISFRTGIFQANTIEMSVGANVIANATAFYVGNSTINSVHSQASSLLQNSVHSSSLTQERLRVGNSTINATVNSTIITIANSTSSANVDPISFKTGIFQANTIEMQVGANVIANSTAWYAGNSSANAIQSQSQVIVQNSTHSASMTQERFLVGNSTINALANSTIISIANSTSSANIDPIQFRTGLFTGNTTVVAVGANVYGNATSLFVGNSTFTSVFGNGSWTGSANLTITPTSHLRVAGALIVNSNTTLSNTLAVTGAATLSNTLGVTGATALSNTLSVTGAANVLSTFGVTGAANALSTLGVGGATTLANTLTVTGNATFSNTVSVTGLTTLNTANVTGAADFRSTVTFENDYVIEVESNTNVGTSTLTPILIYRFPKATYSSAKLMIQVKNQGNTQMSEALVAHDGTTAFHTVYGTVASPGFANNNASPLGTFIANVNGANVDLLINQTIANSATKVVAHLIK